MGSCIGLFCKRDLLFYRLYWPKPPHNTQPYLPCAMIHSCITSYISHMIQPCHMCDKNHSCFTSRISHMTQPYDPWAIIHASLPWFIHVFHHIYQVWLTRVTYAPRLIHVLHHTRHISFTYVQRVCTHTYILSHCSWLSQFTHLTRLIHEHITYITIPQLSHTLPPHTGFPLEKKILESQLPAKFYEFQCQQS